MQKLKIFESISGEKIKYGRSQTAYRLDRKITMTYKDRTEDVDWIRYSPAYKSYSVSVGGRDCNLKQVTFASESDKKDLEEFFDITL